MRVTVRVTDLTGKGDPYEADFLVDTGATDCMAPRDRLEAAGVRPEGKSTYELADGEAVEYEYGFARIAFMGDETIARMTFGPPGTEPILGVIALESVGITVDPSTRELRRMPVRLLK
jgi:clan AA aspartic protease